MAISSGTMSTSAGPLDVATLVANLMSAEKVALKPLTTQAGSYQSLISAYGSLKSAMSTYQTALNSLTKANFSAQKSSVVNNGSGTTLTTDPFTASINTDASTKMMAQKLQSAGFPSTQVFTAGDTMAIKIGANSPVFITLQADSTLAGLRDTINASKAGVTASITTDGSGDHLVLESNTAGTANTIKIQANNSLSSLVYDPASGTPSTMTQIQAPRDATAAVSGSYAIAVSQLAQAQKITSAGFASNYAFDTGVLAIKTGNGSTTLINPAVKTLTGVRDAINASSAGVNASIVSDGTSSHLVLAAKDSGATNTIRVTGTESFSIFNFDPSGNITSPGVATTQTYDAATGGLTLNVGGTTTAVALTGAGLTLINVRDAINTANAGVTASITNDGTQDHLVLTPSGTGATSPVSLTGTGDFVNLSGSTMGQLLKAQDAKLTIDGVNVTSTKNQVVDAISGVTLDLTKVTTASDKFTLNISNDASGITTATNTFVSAYNALVKAIDGMTQQKPSTKLGERNASDPLASETAVLSIMTQMRTTLFGNVNGGSVVRNLSDIGISFQKDGTLALDSAKLTSAATKNFADIANLFTSTAGTNADGTANPNGTSGILTNLQKLVNGFLADGGVIDTKTKGLEASLKINTARQSAVQNRLNNLQDLYTNQFNRLNLTLASMQSTQNYLTQQLAKLSKAGG